MKSINRINTTWKNVLESSPETLAMWRNLLFIFVFIDMFGIYWYLGLKKFGMSLMIVCFICLAVVLFLERRQNQDIFDKVVKEVKNMAEKDKKEDEKEEKKETKKEDDEEPEEENGFGLPSPEEYNKRLEKAIGM